MDRFDITVEPATPQAVEPFGRFLAPIERVPVFASWDGAMIHGPVPIEIGSGGEMLLATLAARTFPVACTLIERHFKHSQVYLPANGKPFVMLLGAATEKDVPDYAGLRAFLFDGTAGIALDKGVWHDFPYALSDDTRFWVLLRQEAHVTTEVAPLHAMDADGPDLQRRAMRPRATITVYDRNAPRQD